MAKTTVQDQNVKKLKEAIRIAGTIAAYQAFIEILEEYSKEYADDATQARKAKPRDLLFIESSQQQAALWKLQADTVRIASKIDKV